MKGLKSLLKVPIGKGLAGKVAFTGKMAQADDAEEYFQPLPKNDNRPTMDTLDLDNITGRKTRCFICAPTVPPTANALIRNNVACGAILVLNKRGARSFADADVEVGACTAHQFFFWLRDVNTSSQAVEKLASMLGVALSRSDKFLIM